MKHFGQRKKEDRAQIDMVVLEEGRELNREFIAMLKEVEGGYTPESYKDMRRNANKQRIAALGLTLIQGGKE